VINEIISDATSRMDKSMASFKTDLAKLRTGRANVSILEHVMVPYYGSDVPLSQVANVNVEDARTLSVVPWEKTMVAAVEKAIMTSDLGLNPATSGTNIRVPLPALTEERRRDMTRLVRQAAEAGRVSVRNIRRDMISQFKELLKEKEITEDDLRKSEDKAQKLTDKYTADIETVVQAKEKDLMAI
jgi:ribosome recycling factor